LEERLYIGDELPPTQSFSTPPEVLLGVALVDLGQRTPEGNVIAAVTPAWSRFLDALASDSSAFMLLDPRQMEELIAGAYSQDGWKVVLTPRSGDRGRDIIATRTDVGAIRVLDQVKRYAPGHIVPADDVRAIYGVLGLDPKASKAVITTTSRFAPGVYEEFASVMPTRLDSHQPRWRPSRLPMLERSSGCSRLPLPASPHEFQPVIPVMGHLETVYLLAARFVSHSRI
jgi:restriction system protein